MHRGRARGYLKTVISGGEDLANAPMDADAADELAEMGAGSRFAVHYSLTNLDGVAAQRSWASVLLDALLDHVMYVVPYVRFRDGELCGGCYNPNVSPPLNWTKMS